jgi:hypothetical protein
MKVLPNLDKRGLHLQIVGVRGNARASACLERRLAGQTGSPLAKTGLLDCVMPVFFRDWHFVFWR